MKTLLTLAAATVLLANAGDALAQGGRTQLTNICRLKGQEENVLRGIGLVVGLNGTGESNDLATMRALSRALELMGNPVSTTGRFDQQAQEALRKGKNAALVMVTARVPSTGARSGDKLDCTVSAMNGKSLVGGQLISAALQGPNTQDGAVYALCEGSLQIADPTQPMVANIHGGCQMSRDVFTPYVSDDGWITIVLDPNHADFVVAESIAAQIASFYAETFAPAGQSLEDDQVRELFVLLQDAQNIRVKVPEGYTQDPVAFVALLLEREVYAVEPEARVVCNTRTGSVVISGEVEIGDVIFVHQNLVIEAGNTPEFQPISASESVRPKLDRLVEALANLRVPPKDVIEIIRGIDRLGKLHAKLIISESSRDLAGSPAETQQQSLTMNGIHSASLLSNAGPAKAPSALVGGVKNDTSDALQEARERKEAFGQFVGETFIGQMLKSMRQTVGEPAYFHGGSAEKQFQARLDAQIAQDLATSGPDGLADEMFASSFPADAALLKQEEAASLEALNALRRR